MGPIRQGNMSKIAIAWPGEAVRSIMEHDPDVIFFNEQGWWIYDLPSKSRKNYEFKLESVSDLIGISVPEIRCGLNWWSPIWTRWLGSAEEYELLRARSVLLVLKIICGIRRFRIKSIIVHTGVPHHWDSSVLSLACEMSKIKQIFLYAIVFDDRLLPLLMDANIFSRRPLGLRCSNIDYESVINDFVANKLKNIPPITNTKPLFWKTSYLIAILLVSFFAGLQLLQNIRSIFFGKKTVLGGVSIKDYSFSARIAMLNRQREFLSAYRKNQVGGEYLNKLTQTSTPKLLIAAHYQPEATSFPEGGGAGNHIDIVAAIRLKGYEDELLYKEHPATRFYFDGIIGQTRVGLYRSRDYLKDLQDLRCLFLPSNINLSICSRQCSWYVPVTISGTIALERALVGLHTIISGEPWFKGLPGLIHLSQIESLQTIDPCWAIPDVKLAKEARKYMVNMLSNNTLINYPGIGIGLPSVDLQKKQQFSDQFNSLIGHLK